MLTKMKRLILLSGMPFLTSPKDLFTILKMLRPTVFNDFFDYAYRYCNPKHSESIDDYNGISTAKEL